MSRIRQCWQTIETNMHWIRSHFRTIVINVLLVLALFGSITIFPVLGIRFLNAYSDFRSSSEVDRLLALPNYVDISWAEQYFQDQGELRHSYHDYLVWAPDQIKTETINIGEGGYRRTVQSIAPNGEVVWLFGGSTLFGLGVNDTNTIPSQLARISNRPIRNFGVNGYVSRQNVSKLIQLYSEEAERDKGGIPRTVVFYGGVNDALYSCRADKSPSVTLRQASIRTAIEMEQAVQGGGIGQIFRPSLVFLDHFMTRLRASRVGGIVGGPSEGQSVENIYQCDDDSGLAAQAAKGLIENWKLAQGIVERHGDRFVGVLQPVAALSRTRLDHLPATDELDRQYRSVYPHIRRYATDADLEFFDLSGVLDRDEYIYIDDCHVTPNGNVYIAEAIAKSVFEK